MTIGRGLWIAPFLILGLGLVQASDAEASTLEDVRSRGILRCAVLEFTPFGSSPAVQRAWQGFNRDLCRVVAAAVLGDAAAVELLPVSDGAAQGVQTRSDLQTLGEQRGGLLSKGETPLRPTAMAFAKTQVVLVPAGSPVSSLADLAGQSVCVPAGEETQAFERRIQRDGMELQLVSNADAEVLRGAMVERCSALSAQGLNAASLLDLLPDSQKGWIHLPDVMNMTPLGPLVPAGDPQWQDIVSWSIYALVTAEERKISSGNADTLAKDSRDPRIRRVLGLEEDMGGQVGLDRRWAYQIIKQVGNYAEIYDRHFGADSPLMLPRGPNALWLDGGLLQAPAFQ